MRGSTRTSTRSPRRWASSRVTTRSGSPAARSRTSRSHSRPRCWSATLHQPSPTRSARAGSARRTAARSARFRAGSTARRSPSARSALEALIPASRGRRPGRRCGASTRVSPRMTVRELLGDGPEVEVVALAYDNRAVVPGTLFFCVPGFTRDGHDFAPDAVARGAAALVVQRPLGLGVPELQVDDVRSAMAVAAARFYGDPTARLPVIGITGTNGKTTKAFLVRSPLEAAGRPCGLLGTVMSVIGGVEHPVVRTTPEAIDLQRAFAEMAAAGDLACAIEISSHALELRRADGIHVAVAVFTNLTQDHLDFHPDMEAYFQAKRLLFASPLTRARIANADDAYGRRLAQEFPDTLTFGLGDGWSADYRAVDVRQSFTGSSFTAVTPDGEFA